MTRSWGRDTTKGGHSDAIPIAGELAPYLRAAVAASPSELVFPKGDGSMMNPQVRLQGVLRRALGRAGVVLGYRHVCRARVNGEAKRDQSASRCGHFEAAPDKAPRRCPTHGDLLWPVPQVRPIRFHDLRHTTASLLMMAGVNPAAVQRILRHSDPKITTGVYGHLAPGYLLAEVNRLAFGLVCMAPAEAPVQVAVGSDLAPFAAPLRAPGEAWRRRMLMEN